MQKIVNAIAIASGAVSLAVVGLGGYVFIRKDAIIDNIKSKVMESVLPGGVGGALGGGGLGGKQDASPAPVLAGDPAAASMKGLDGLGGGAGASYYVNGSTQGGDGIVIIRYQVAVTIA